jgi:hypothetical protein
MGKGFVVGFTWLQQGKQLLRKILLISRLVKKKIGFGNGLGFQTHKEELGLKSCIPKEKSNNNI